MEHKRCEESRHNTLDSNCKKILPDVEKSSISETVAIKSMKNDEEWSNENNLASPTPQKTTQPPRSKNRGNALPVRAIKQICNFQNEDVLINSAEQKSRNNNNTDVPFSEISESSPNAVCKVQKHEGSKLPDKYNIIADFFDRMVSSLRLLSLCKKLSSFQNICIQVEILTKRRFLYSHLAQIKYIFPEAIQIDKILTHDESTLCMKPEMKITLLAGEFEDRLDQSGSITLRKIFRDRLLDFLNAHPEGSDIPEALLPEPFNKTNDAMMLKPLSLGSSAELSQQTSVEFGSLTNPSHFSPSFCRQFSQKIVPETEKAPLLHSPALLLSVTAASESHHDIKSPINKESVTSSSVNIKSPARLTISPDNCGNANFFETTPKPSPFSTPIKLTETPVQATPKRSMLSPDEDVTMETRTSSHSDPRRVLMFSSPLKNDGNDANLIVRMTEKDRGMCDTSVQAAMPRGIHVEEEITRSATILQSVQSQTGLSKRQQMLACLPALFNKIHLIFQSAHGSPITKQELVHKIIWQNFDIIEKREVEEQLELLEKLVPDWIYGKIVPSGDFIYCLRKSSDPNSVLERLVKAT